MADRLVLNREQLLAKLRKAIGKKTLREFAELVPMSAGTLHETLTGKRKPGPTLLDYMGYEERETRVSVYVPK